MRILTSDPAPPLRHSWRHCFGQGRAAELLRVDCLGHIARARQMIGFKYLRFHGLFHDEMAVVTRREDGSLAFQWRMIDQVFDSLLRMGVRPFLELNPMPLALASGEETIFRWKMNVSPPREYSEWGQLVSAFARHCVQRYGLHEVRRWYFEVWNEPNLPGFWSGTQEAYWKLYRHAALAMKSVDPDLRVGGPATAQARWIPEMIQWCTDNGVPLDFVSTHSYQQDELCFYPKRKGSPHAASDYLLDQFRRVHDEVAASSMPHLEIHWTEWNSLAASADGKISWTNSASTDALYAGSAALHHATRADALCTTQSWWIISDVFGEHGISPLPFSHTYGLFTAHGLPKASLHAFKWLARMTGKRLRLDPSPRDPAHGCLVSREAGTIRALLWFHPPVEKAEGEWSGELVLDLEEQCLQTRAHLGRGHGSAYETWRDWGCPPNLTPAQEDALRHASEPAQDSTLCAPGSVRNAFTLQPYEVLFFEWAAVEAPAANRGILSEQSPARLETELAAKTK